MQNHMRAPIYPSLEPYPTAKLKRNPLKNRTLRPKISGLWSENRDIDQHFCIFERKITPVLSTFYLTNGDFSGTLKASSLRRSRVALRSLIALSVLSHTRKTWLKFFPICIKNQTILQKISPIGQIHTVLNSLYLKHPHQAHKTPPRTP